MCVLVLVYFVWDSAFICATRVKNEVLLRYFIWNLKLGGCLEVVMRLCYLFFKLMLLWEVFWKKEFLMCVYCFKLNNWIFLIKFLVLFWEKCFCFLLLFLFFVFLDFFVMGLFGNCVFIMVGVAGTFWSSLFRMSTMFELSRILKDFNCVLVGFIVWFLCFKVILFLVKIFFVVLCIMSCKAFIVASVCSRASAVSLGFKDRLGFMCLLLMCVNLMYWYCKFLFWCCLFFIDLFYGYIVYFLIYIEVVRVVVRFAFRRRSVVRRLFFGIFYWCLCVFVVLIVSCCCVCIYFFYIICVWLCFVMLYL